MNYYWIVSGVLMVLGGLAHTYIGERNVISKLKTLREEPGNLGQDAFNLIRWFWYLGSFISFWVGALALIIGTTDGVITDEPQMGKLLASLMLGFSVLTFGIVAILNPRELKKLGQVVILVAVTILLWVGSIG